MGNLGNRFGKWFGRVWEMDLGNRFGKGLENGLGNRFGKRVGKIGLGNRFGKWFGKWVWEISLENGFGKRVWEIGMGNRFGKWALGNDADLLVPHHPIPMLNFEQSHPC